jgi:ribosome-associated heat shock protein Hsp15
MADSVRADKWLWATRFFKTRSAAATACEGGKIKRLGHPVKPATALHVGDRLEVPFYEGPGTRSIAILGLLEQRVGAPQAQACYEETTSTEILEANRLHLQEKRERLLREGDQGRPTKRNRREIDRHFGFFE